jgi:superoxide reductase
MLTKTKDISKECAQDILCGVNTTENVDSASDLEKKHLPVIEAPDRVTRGEWFDVTVRVGALLEHPNEPGHHIEFIELYADDTYLGRMDCTGQMCQPIMCARVRLEHDYTRLRAFEHCNLHGSWEWDKEIQVK